MATNLADDHVAIKARMDKIQAERAAALAGEPAKADVTEPVNNYVAPEWPTMYGVYQAPDDFMG